MEIGQYVDEFLAPVAPLPHVIKLASWPGTVRVPGETVSQIAGVSDDIKKDDIVIVDGLRYRVTESTSTMFGLTIKVKPDGEA